MENDFSNLIRAAQAARSNSYSPYSGFAVGAAVQGSSGRIFSGANIENISYGLTLCAERAAVAAAVAQGERELLAIAVVADSVEPVVPCGACRQFLAEFNPGLQVVSVNLIGQKKVESLRVLLPEPRRGILQNAKR